MPAPTAPRQVAASQRNCTGMDMGGVAGDRVAVTVWLVTVWLVTLAGGSVADGSMAGDSVAGGSGMRRGTKGSSLQHGALGILF